jgi:hypothetical protein
MTTNCPVSAYSAPGLKRHRKILSGNHADNAGWHCKQGTLPASNASGAFEKRFPEEFGPALA